MRLARVMAAAMVVLCLGGTARAERADFCFAAWPPFSVMDGDHATGITVEILRLAAGRAGFEPSFTELPWARCLKETEEGRFDAALDGNPERQEYAHGRHSTTPVAIVFWVRDAAPAQTFTSYDQFAGQSVGYTLGYNYVEAAMTALKDQLVVAPNDEAQVAMLTAGRVDAIIGDVVVVGAIAKRQQAPIRALHPAAAETDYFPLFNPTRQAKLARIDAAVGAMIASGEVDTIYADRTGLSHSDILRMLHRVPATN